MLDTLTGKIPEKLSRASDYAPLPTLEEMDSANRLPSSSSIFESVQNNWLAIVAFLLLLAFTGFNILAYYLQRKNDKQHGDNEQEVDGNPKPLDSVTKTFNDAYEYVKDSISKMSGPSNEETSVESQPVTKPPVTKPPVTKPPVTKPPVANTPVTKNQVPNITSAKITGSNMEEEDNIDSNAEINALNSALDNASSKKGDSAYKASESLKTIKAKAGWCFVGEEKGFRNCAEVGENDKCLSGDIFPTSQVCINPSLRA